MDALFAMITEAILYLALYLVDTLRWWRFLLSAVTSAIASLLCYNFAHPPQLAALLFVIGIGVGLVWEYQTRSPRAGDA